MRQKDKILSLLNTNDTMTQVELAEAMYGDKDHTPNIYSALTALVNSGAITRIGRRPAYYSLAGFDRKAPVIQLKVEYHVNVPEPSVGEVEKYLARWNNLENYYLQEDALDKLFLTLCPGNSNISDILVKVATLNDFYSTNIFTVYPVAKHILSLKIDNRLKAGDATLVRDLQRVEINGIIKNFYSFATKYCSHHNPLEYPIYDSYVARVLKYFRDKDSFAKFHNNDLKDYIRFKEVFIDFSKFYGLERYNLKQIDKYIWQLGKEYFPKNYGKKE
ncbi:hypothetical protein [Senimuribacter intestinalis]|uniref:hypothetical protein n=1 Tax=Senimuribacter intestinalis TaxID=2941507 RepID=UPI00203A9197|nr:hypothetical protein [Senimuribacter intestinalis]